MRLGPCFPSEEAREAFFNRVKTWECDEIGKQYLVTPALREVAESAKPGDVSAYQVIVGGDYEAAEAIYDSRSGVATVVDLADGVTTTLVCPSVQHALLARWGE